MRKRRQADLAVQPLLLTVPQVATCLGLGRTWEISRSGSASRHVSELPQGSWPSPMRFHDLRHSAATFLLSMGIHPKVVQEILGHSTISMTMDMYSHVLPSMQQEAMGKMDSLFGRDV